MRYFQFVILLFLTYAITQAQVGVLQVDKPYYFSGEYLYYNIFFGEMATDSAMINVRFAKDGEILTSHFNRCVAGATSGYVKLPHDLASGVYVLEVFAYQQDDARAISLCAEAFTVLSDFNEKQVTFADRDKERIMTPLPDRLTDLNGMLVPSDQTMDGKISWSGFQANSVSLSVRKKDTEMTGPFVRTFSHMLHRTPIMNRIPVAGHRKLHIENQNRSPLMYACQPESLQFELTKVASDGAFTFAFDDIHGQQPIQFVEFFGFTMDLKMREEMAMEEGIYREVIDSQITQSLERYQDRKKIFQLFNRTVQDPSFVQVPNQTNQVPPDFDFDVQDYAIRGTIVDLLKELSSPLKFRKRKSGYVAKVLYEVGDYKYYYSAPALFIINGIAIHDSEFVSQLLLQEIERIRIYSRVQTLEKVVRGHRIGGVILIDLIDPLYKIPEELYLPRTVISGLQTPIQFPITLPDDPALPRIDPLVYWEPSKPLERLQQVTFSCPKPDITGDYLIEILVRNEHGEMMMGGLTLTLE